MTSARWADNDEELLAMIKAAVTGRDVLSQEVDTAADATDVDATEVDATDVDASGAHAAPIGDAVIARMRQAAKAAYTWRTIDQELDRLTMLSDSDLVSATRVRGPGVTPYRIVEFHGHNLDLELEIGDHSLVGQVYPAMQGVVTLFTANGASVESPVDEVGCFLFARPAAGPFRLRCDIGTADVVTEWITLT